MKIKRFVGISVAGSTMAAAMAAGLNAPMALASTPVASPSSVGNALSDAALGQISSDLSTISGSVNLAAAGAAQNESADVPSALHAHVSSGSAGASGASPSLSCATPTSPPVTPPTEPPVTPPASSNDSSGSTTTTAPVTPPTEPPTSPPSGSNAFQILQQKVEKGLSDRQARLSDLTSRVASAKDLTPSDQTALQGLLANETSGINALAAKVPNDTTVDQLRADATSMVCDYRVYVVMTPQVGVTIVSDTENTDESRIVALYPKIQAAIAAAQNQGENVSGAIAAFQDLQNQVTNAQGLSSGLDSIMLAQTPQDYPGDQGVIGSAITSCKTVASDLQAARDDLKAIKADLQAVTTSGGSGSTGGSTGSASGSTGSSGSSSSGT